MNKTISIAVLGVVLTWAGCADIRTHTRKSQNYGVPATANIESLKCEAENALQLRGFTTTIRKNHQGPDRAGLIVTGTKHDDAPVTREKVLRNIAMGPLGPSGHVLKSEYNQVSIEINQQWDDKTFTVASTPPLNRIRVVGTRWKVDMNNQTYDHAEIEAVVLNALADEVTQKAAAPP